jgi:hypothetical protein
MHFTSLTGAGPVRRGVGSAGRGRAGDGCSGDGDGPCPHGRAVVVLVVGLVFLFSFLIFQSTFDRVRMLRSAEHLHVGAGEDDELSCVCPCLTLAPPSALCVEAVRQRYEST